MRLDAHLFAPNSTAPPVAEGGEGREALHESPAPCAQSTDQAGNIIHAADSLERDRSNDAVSANAKFTLQILGRAGRTGIDGIVKHRIVEPGRQEVTPHRIPVLRPVYFQCLSLSERPDVRLG